MDPSPHLRGAHNPATARSPLPQRLRDLKREVRDLVDRATFPSLTRQVAAALDRGETVPFGRLALRREGVCKGSTMQPWAAIDTAQVWDGKFEVKLKGGGWGSFVKIKTKHIPNVHVFLSLLERLRWGQAAQDSSDNDDDD